MIGMSDQIDILVVQAVPMQILVAWNTSGLHD